VHEEQEPVHASHSTHANATNADTILYSFIKTVQQAR
jgi:hypothetical protein